MRRVILKCDYGPTANLLLTAAVRDLHKSCPGLFQIDVRTRYPEMWLHNPHLSSLDDDDPETEQIVLGAPLAERKDTSTFRLTHGFLQYFRMLPEVKITPTHFKGDLYLSHQEKAWFSQVQELTKVEIPFWLISVGGRSNETTRCWDFERFQAVVDAFRDRILFVQVAEKQDNHQCLEGAIDFRGRTDLRQLVRLMYHAEGVLSPLNLLTHLAAATETSRGKANRACVVIAGGSQSSHWQRYPTHQFLHTIGALPCCETMGCGRGRTHLLGDGSVDDSPENLCVDPVGDLPHCMEMVSEADVSRAIRRYFDGGLLNYLSTDEVKVAQSTLALLRPHSNPHLADESNTARSIQSVQEYA